jgi:hypothetical protein
MFSPIRAMAHQRLKVRVLGDEVGFRIQLDRHAAAVLDRHADQPFGRHPPRFLRGLGQTLGAQPVNRRLHVARRFDQCFFCVHHSCAGRFAQFFHHLCGDGHVTLSSCDEWVGRGTIPALNQVDDRLRPVWRAFASGVS